MDFGPLHQLLGLPEAGGCQAVAPGIADAIGAIGFRGDGEPRRSGDGVVHGGGAAPYRATPSAAPLGRGKENRETTRCREEILSAHPPPEMMGKRFKCRDVHRLDCCHSPVADRCSPGRRRGHDSLLHLALETIGRAVGTPAQGSPNRSGTAHRPAEESRSHRSVDRWRWLTLWLREPERGKRTWQTPKGVGLHTVPRLAPFARGGNPEAL